MNKKICYAYVTNLQKKLYPHKKKSFTRKKKVKKISYIKVQTERETTIYINQTK